MRSYLMNVTNYMVSTDADNSCYPSNKCYVSRYNYAISTLKNIISYLLNYILYFLAANSVFIFTSSI